MRKITFAFLQYIFVFIFALCFPRSVFAHGGEPRLEMNMERANPGSIVEIRGVDFDYEEVIALSLMRAEMQIPLGDVTADVEGTFTQIIVLPADLPIGEYNFRARTNHHVVNGPILTIWGVAASSDEEGEDPREEEDGLLAPMPTFAPGTSSTPLPETKALETPPSKGSSATFIYSILLGIGLVTLLSVRILRKR